MVSKYEYRAIFQLLSSTGANFGTVISLPLSGWLCSLELWGGWPLAFYLFGGLGMIWYIFWLIFVFNTPAEHTRIDPQERAYIEACVEPKHEVDHPASFIVSFNSIHHQYQSTSFFSRMKTPAFLGDLYSRRYQCGQSQSPSVVSPGRFTLCLPNCPRIWTRFCISICNRY